MKTNKYGDYSPFWVRRKLTTIRNRCIYYLKTKDDIEKSSNYLWSQCFNKARNKLYYRFNDWNKDNLRSNDIWISAIATIKSGLKHRFDNEYAWRYAEYTIVEKMNKQGFYRIESPNLLWHQIAVDKAGQANHLWNRKPRLKKRTEKYSWTNVINISKVRIKNYEYLALSQNEKFWDLCFKSNYEKLSMRYRWLFSWEACIHRNFKRLNRQWSWK